MDDKINNKFPYFDDSISYFDIDDIDDIDNKEEDLTIDIEKWEHQLEILNKILDDEDDDDDVIFSIPKD